MDVSRAADRPAAERARSLFPGVLACAVVAAAATFLSQHYGAPAMLFAPVLLSVTLTIAVSMLVARLLGFQPLFGLLSGGAVAICGASA
jgi:uncharacterized membrane protein YadS